MRLEREARSPEVFLLFAILLEENGGEKEIRTLERISPLHP
jgi:hypothetical protein